MTRTNTTLDQYEVWFLTGSQHLYGAETLTQVAEQSQTISTTLDATTPVRLVWKPVLTDTHSIHTTMLEANARSTVIGVIAWMHTFSPAKMWISGLSALQKPLLHLHTQLHVELPWSTIDFDFMNLNQSAHGDREFGYIQSRLGIERATVVGHVSDKKLQSRVSVWMRAAAGVATSRNLKIARFGDNMRQVAVTEGDKTEAEYVFGTQVNTWGVTELADAVATVSEHEIDELIEEYEESYSVAPELRRSGERAMTLREAAAIELGLRAFLENGNCEAFTTNFEDLGTLPQLPGLAVQRLMAEGYGFGAEGDWKTALLLRVASVMGSGLPGSASLMEDYTYDLTPGAETILGAHMLEVSPGLTRHKPRLEVHPLSIGGKKDPARLVFHADPGPGVVIALCDIRDRFRIVANAVEVVEPVAPLSRLPVGCAIWRPEPNLQTSAWAWLNAGGAHHTVLSTALGAEAFAEFARMTGTEFLLINKDTTEEDFLRELRWNAAYYRLTRGI
ncbi:L-arabinose isomerase [Lysinibacter sp. HNR]|uniref:L-arabinose isomerase n=1 Tax=Lysinibacter sp. HNR TaxID=3031408 RepID=UPI002435A05D|nr:L-arabinose isomerase [Lysinibacter sp. HNR]WGD37708.1 L-arabinose isomerase [Lysinibacter sp. HNR]